MACARLGSFSLIDRAFRTLPASLRCAYQEVTEVDTQIRRPADFLGGSRQL
jgi:hypothetical protein